MTNDYAAMTWFPCLKAWGHLPEYHDASLAARAIVDGSMRIFMDRGHLPQTPTALRRAIGADEREFTRAHEEAQQAIRVLEPLWAAELQDAYSRFDRLRQRNRANGAKGGRVRCGQREPTGVSSGKPNGEPIGFPTGQPDGHPSGKPIGVPTSEPVSAPVASTGTATRTREPSGSPPMPPRRARSSGSEPDEFETFWSEFRKAYPRRPRQPWSEARRSMLKAMERHPDLDRRSVLDAARAYRELMDQTGKTNTDKVAHASTWINQDRWECDYTTVMPSGKGWDDESIF